MLLIRRLLIARFEQQPLRWEARQALTGKVRLQGVPLFPSLLWLSELASRVGELGSVETAAERSF